MEDARKKTCLKSFFKGLVGVCVLYGLLFAYSFFMGGAALQEMEDSLSGYAVLIERGEYATSDVVTDLKPSDMDAEAQPHAPPPRPDTHAQQHDEMHTSQQTEDDPVALTDYDTPPEDFTAPDVEIKAGDSSDLSDMLGSAYSDANALTPAPIDGLYEETEFGALPVKAGSRTPFEVYKKPFTPNLGRKTVGVAVLDYGLSEQLSASILKTLPSSVSLILSPYAPAPTRWQERARKDGHELWLSLPIENQRYPYDDPGAQGLLSTVSLAYNEERLNWVLGRTTGYAGLAGFTDSTLSKSSGMFRNIWESLFRRGLGYLELNTEGSEFVSDIAAKERAPFTNVHFLIAPSSGTFEEGSAIVAGQERSVIILKPTPKNIAALSAWLNALAQEGYEIAPVSSLMRTPTLD